MELRYLFDKQSFRASCSQAVETYIRRRRLVPVMAAIYQESFAGRKVWRLYKSQTVSTFPLNWSHPIIPNTNTYNKSLQFSNSRNIKIPQYQFIFIILKENCIYLFRINPFPSHLARRNLGLSSRGQHAWNKPE